MARVAGPSGPSERKRASIVARGRPSPCSATALLCLCLALSPRAGLRAQSLSVGDEVIYSGGPSQPPQSKQTGLSFQAKIVAMSGEGTSKTTNEAPLPTAKRLPRPELSRCSSEELRQRLGADDARVRKEACRLFAQRSDLSREERVSELRRSLWDEDEAVVVTAAVALASLRALECREEIEELLGQDEPLLVLGAIRALESLGDPRARPALRKLVDGGDPRFSEAAKKAWLGLAGPRDSR